MFEKLFWLCQSSEYTWSSCMFYGLLKRPGVPNMPEFWIWYGFICKGYTESRIWLRMAQYSMYDWLHLNSAWICFSISYCPWMSLNMTEYWWMSLNALENLWINWFDSVRVLNLPHHLRYLKMFWICFRH